MVKTARAVPMQMDTGQQKYMRTGQRTQLDDDAGSDGAEQYAVPESARRQCGRPMKFSPALAEAICGELEAGKSLRLVCQSTSMPSRAAVQRWLARGSAEPDKYPDLARFVDQYAHARETQAELIMDDMLEIADDGRDDYEKVDDGNGGFVFRFNPDRVQRARLRIDARKWMLARMFPKRYGKRP